MATERKIGKDLYRCEPLSAEEGLKLLLRVTAFFKAMPDMLGSIVAKDTSATAIGAFMATVLSDEVNRDEAHGLIVHLAELCTINGEPAIVGHKPNTLSDTVRLAWFAMEVNFRDFLAESLGSQ